MNAEKLALPTMGRRVARARPAPRTLLGPALVALGILAFEGTSLAQGAPRPPAADKAPPALESSGEKAADADPKAADADPKAAEPEAAPGPDEERAPIAAAKPRPKRVAPPPMSYVPVEPAREEPAPEPRREPPKPHDQHWSVGFGFTGAAVTSDGYEPYSSNDTLPMLSLFGSFTPWSSRPLSVHLVGQYDYGGASGKARGADSSLDIHRLALGLEGRYQPISRMRLFVRAMPAMVHVGATMTDQFLPATLESASWNFGADLTGGAAARIGAIGHPDLPLVSFWISLDMGYRIAPAADMKFRPGNLTEDDEGRRFGEIAMKPLDLSGFLGKLAVSVSF